MLLTLPNGKSIDLADVRDSTCLVSLHIGMYTGFTAARELVDAGAAKLEADTGKTLDKKRARSSVRLVNEARIKEMEKFSNDTRALWRAHTAPWKDDGTRIAITAMLLQKLQPELDAREREWKTKLVPAFVRDYPAMINEAAQDGQLGPLFNAKKFPSVAAIASKFPFEVMVTSVPDVEDFRIPASYKQRTQDAVANAIIEAQKDAYEQLRAPLARISESLRTYAPGAGHAGSFQYTMITQLIDVLDAIPAKNILGDNHLNSLADLARKALLLNGAVSTTDDAKELCKDLRTNDYGREMLADAADALIAQMSQFI